MHVISEVPVFEAERVVEVPELGGAVRVRPLPLSLVFSRTASQAARLVESGEWASDMLHHCVRNADGDRLMTPDHWELFGGRYRDAAVRLVQVCQEMSGLTEPGEQPEGKPVGE